MLASEPKALKDKRKAIGKMQRVSAHHVAASARNRAPAADAGFLEAAARRLAEQFRLPLRVARARVEALAVSAQPLPRGDGFAGR
jgi:hypothetical protein